MNHALLALCDQLAWYALDKNQQVMHWSSGAEILTGLNAKAVLGKVCPQGYEITEEMQEIILPDSVKFNTRPLHDQHGQFAGGVAMLAVGPQNPKLAAREAKNPKQQEFHGILSRSPAMRAVFQVIENAAETTATVLVRGESGSGKELVARAIHRLSPRCDAPFLAINCAALSSNLLDSELFGHVRGAFTGAIKDHNGLFLRANGGTLFLDEVAELPLELQAKLLRVLQERNFIPVGGDRSISVDVRIVAATHRSLREQVKIGEFREDLMYRLRVVPIFIPPLRERREDISLLLWHFIGLHNAVGLNKIRSRQIEKIDPSAMQVLLDYHWPGNIRELQNVVEYAFAVGRGTVLRFAELPPEFREAQANVTQNPQRVRLSSEQEAEAIRAALAEAKGSISQAMLTLGMSRATFWRKRKLYGL